MIMVREPVIKDLYIFLLNKFWDKPYIQDATYTALKKCTSHLIENLNEEPNIEKNKLLIRILTSLKGEKIHEALSSFGDSLKKVKYWSADSKTAIGPVSILANDILDLLEKLGPLSIDIVIEAYCDDSDFDQRLKEINGRKIKEDEGNHLLWERTSIMSYKLIKKQKLEAFLEQFGITALEHITEKLRGIDKESKYQKLMPIYEKLSKKFSIVQKDGYKLLL
jgi:hypothetical protein